MTKGLWEMKQVYSIVEDPTIEEYEQILKMVRRRNKSYLQRLIIGGKKIQPDKVGGNGRAFTKAQVFVRRVYV